ncbi:hemopexin repeat-containing protein [Paractinoplanes rishiriensis]|uniref:Hemopexin n=1 Tax=Paractinoplanes rishiriensis TaxID=1050105 RepID=A0A919JWL2_9ACTN|nr:hemopexin repeat-containing protein [Actinoplanes rishiriensis]GIE94609.1 hypothetical protein Ari01nite_20740 [Actinoplanes rishiriensis]
MLKNDSSPSYEQLFGELNFRTDDDARSVFSPAAYLVELLGLLEESFDRPSLLDRRPDLRRVVLDADNTFVESPYLDIVNEVLERLVGANPYQTLRTSIHPFGLPFSLRNERLRSCLDHLRVTPEELYRLFAAEVDHDLVAREYLRLSAEDVAVVTTELPDESAVKTAYGRPDDGTLSDLQDVVRFSAATGLAGAQVRELVAVSPDAVTMAAGGTRIEPAAGAGAVGVGWFERAHRLIRLARMTGLTLTDLGLVVTSCCAGRIDAAALRTVAVAVRLRRDHDLTAAQVCELAGAVDPAVIEGCSGDIMASRNRHYRARLAAAAGVAEGDIAATVRRYRERYTGAEPSPFDRGEIGQPEITLLRRVARLAAALGIAVDELFDVLVALESDPSLHRYSTFVVLGAAPAGARDYHRVLSGGDPAAGLWLTQLLFAVVTWMRATGFAATELAEILGGRPGPADADQVAVLDAIKRAFDPAAFTAGVFVSDRFSERAAKVIYDVLTAYDTTVVSARDDRLLRVDPAGVPAAASDAVRDLGVIAAEDFAGLGLDQRLTAKICANLVHLGVLRADGTLAVDATAGLRLASDFSGCAEMLFKTISSVVNGTASLFPSDLVALDNLSPQQQAELYDNLIFNGYLNEEGDLRQPDFFLDAGNLADFAVNVDLADVAGAVWQLLDGRMARFRAEPLPIDPEIFADLRLTGAQLAALMESLRFNGYLDAAGAYRDKAALNRLAVADFRLALPFYPHRRAVLDAMRAQVAAFRAELYTVTADDFVRLADDAMGERVLAALDGTYLANGRVRDEALFADPDGALDLGTAFTEAEQATVFRQIGTVLADQRPYRIGAEALAELGLTADEPDQLVAQLTGMGLLDEGRAVAPDRLEYFRNAGNALDFVLPGLEDYSTDIFFLLHAAATEQQAAITEIGRCLADLAQAQRAAFSGALADAFGVPAGTAAAISEAVTGGPAEALDVLLAPVLATADATAGEVTAVPADPHFRLAFRRVRRFALLAGKLGLDPAEIAAVFTDQDLVGKFPEHLVLPPGVTRFDTLLESFDGTIYAFGAGGYWTYSATTYVLTDPAPNPLPELSVQFGGLVRMDAAFRYDAGTEWLIGRDAHGTSHAFTRARGSTRWVPREQLWGRIRNNFDDPARIDAALVDADGRTYLFCGDQYVRYTGTALDVVDEGYPRDTAQWWEREELGAPLPAGFRASIDACFQGLDNRIHLFAGDQWLAGGAGRTAQPIAEVWGKVRNNFDHASRIDAAAADGPVVRLFAGDQQVTYSDCVENDGVRVDEGYPRRITDVPPAFEGRVDAAFVDADGVTHLFQDDRTVALSGPGSVVVPTAQRWGVLRPALPGGKVDAAFVGLDGRTYLFSGETYLRYSTADYSAVDSGYPRLIRRDWGGLDRVDASVVLDGRAYLFGVGGPLFDLPPGLDPGTVTPALRNRLAEHGLTPAKAEGAAPEWRIHTEQGVTLTVRQEGRRTKVFGDGSRFYVRYSTPDYSTPDAGYPKPQTDNWWNLPDGIEFGPVDAVFTGRDDRTYLFSEGRIVVFDARHRWWSEPQSLRGHWDSFPFETVDAAFVGPDGRTYLFHDDQYVRYSGSDYTEVDDGYPRTVGTFWGHVVNHIARTGRVDAALVTDVTETVDGVEVPRTYTYLFSGDQYVRYGAGDYAVVQDGYPRAVRQLNGEPGLAALEVTLDGVDAAYADRRNTYLFRGDTCHVVSATAYRRYDDIPCLPGMSCAFIENGSVLVQKPEGWMRRSALEGRAVSATPFRPRTLRAVPAKFRTGLDAVLTGADGNTYLFQGPSCFNVRLNREYPLAEEWGRPRNMIFQNNVVDAAFVGRDGKTYLFSDDQFVVYPDVAGTTIEGDPRPIGDHWAGLTSVGLAYVRGGVTYLFEKPDGAGRMRCVAYSGTGYGQPDEGYPTTVDAGFWPAPGHFGIPDAVLFEGETMLLLRGRHCLSYNEKTDAWSYPRPIDRVWPGFGRLAGRDEDRLHTAFTAADGATYFFAGERYARYADGVFGAPAEVRERWGLSRNPFIPAGSGATVDAAFVWRGEQTFLFSGNHYVRYTGPDYQYIDTGYPKRIAGHLRTEEPFANLPESFEDALGGPGEPSGIDAVVANDRTVFLFLGGTCHAVSRTTTGTVRVGALGKVRNTIAERQRVDAALVADGCTYLFSGDQYVRYSGHDHTTVDDGYPKSIGDSLPHELSLTPLPDEFADGLDAAFHLPDKRTYLFKGRDFLDRGTLRPVKGAWGTVGNAFTTGRPGIDAAFRSPAGDLYAFRAGQYVRYPAGALAGDPDRPALAEEGFPRTVTDDWGDLPDDFEEGPDGAFTFEGRTYLVKGDRYVRYAGDRYDRVERTFPQEFARRWSSTADYRLSDVHTIVRFVELARAHPGLAAFLDTGAEDPYAYLSGLFGRDAEEVRWARRNSALINPVTAEESRFEIEFLLALVDAFALTDRLGVPLSEVHTDVWSNLYGTTVDVDAAADALHRMLERRTGAADWITLSAQIHNELNVRKRDALVPSVIHLHTEFSTSRDLFERLLIDVDMGSAGTTSRVREAIAATQLYLHRYLLDLEPVTLPAGADPDEVRQRLKRWWSWMRNYRVWEANRKVFLYPENYVRPELRGHKTPAFRALENDLLQGEITDDAVRKAYKRYLDEYTEVSRLAIAGGYVYVPDDVPAGTRRLVVFGRTRTEPRRYYYRSAEFRDGEKTSASWDPWLKVDVQIDAERVDPVHAFGRVFVFWPVVETVLPDDPAKTTIVATRDGDAQKVTAPPPKYRARILYSFGNLNQEWVPAQVLAVDTAQDGPISEVTLNVQASRTVPGGPPGDHDAIVVTCAYTVAGRTVGSCFTLTPELYGLRSGDPVFPPKTADLSRIFAGPDAGSIDPARVVRFNAPADSDDGPWASIDHKGGSFLCRPIIAPAEAKTLQGLRGNDLRLPTTWERINAAFQLADTTLVSFDNTNGRFVLAPPDKVSTGRATQAIGERWGVIDTNLVRTKVVDAVLARRDHIFVFSGDEYYRYPADDLGRLDAGYPKPIGSNEENLPPWSRIDIACTDEDGTEYFYSRLANLVSTSADLTVGQELSEVWHIAPELRPDTAAYARGRAFLIFGDQYLPVAPAGDVALLPLAGNQVGLPETAPPGPSVPYLRGLVQFLSADNLWVVRAPRQPRHERPNFRLGIIPTTINRENRVDAAYRDGEHLYLTAGDEFVRYTVTPDSIPDFIDDGYPKKMAQPITGFFRRNGQRYVLSGSRYALLPDGAELDVPLSFAPILGSWRGLPPEIPGLLTGTMDTDDVLCFFFSGGQYAGYPVSSASPYEIAALPHEIIRLTSSTAYELNRRLLVGGVDALLTPQTQQIDELPGFSATRSDATTIQVSPTLTTGVPASSHLDFTSSNGGYYWEIFCHAPLLIAQALNDAQRFADARRWYEYVFDPTERTDYWRFLPFLAVDVDALVAGCRGDLDDLGDDAVRELMEPVLRMVAAMAPAFHQARELTAAEQSDLAGLAAAGLDGVTAALAGLAPTEVVRSLRERVALIARLGRQYDVMGDRGSLVKAYLDDPFDPHAIAELRPAAYRRAVVMAYIDNVLDWADMLFRQYTAESLDEARMLYILAYDLLGPRPYDLGARVLPPAASPETLDAVPAGETAAVDHLTGDGTLLEGAGSVHAGVAGPYFYVPDNSTFFEYWTRVEDRLRKIRQSLDIMGVSRPVPLFEPPADVLALVRGAATGAAPDEVAAGAAVPLPHYRFGVLFRKAQDLVDRLRQFGGDLLATTEKRDAEELSLLQQRHETAILALTRGIKEAEVTIAAQHLLEMRAARDGAAVRVQHYEQLLAAGLSPVQQAQIEMMAHGANAHFAASGLKIGAAIAKGMPEALLGPFIIGIKAGGEEFGGALEAGADVASTLGEGLSLLGEILGVRADQARSVEDWTVQLATARTDVVQTGYQVAAAEQQVAIAQRELDILNLQAANNEAVATFLTGKFAGAQLYQWMAGRLSTMYFQTYHLAYETARAAERAYQFEQGADSTGGFIRPTSWESRRQGLLAGESLALDLERLGKAYADGNRRGLEITKRVSLLVLDPLALLDLKNTGRCEFALTEALFDRDFPGHYRRQIRTVSVSFDTGEGPVGVNATLTQLDNKTVVSADPRAVKFLLEPKGSPPATVRGDWRASQQIALSDIDEGRDNNGLFELRFDDDRYLPFEGTGAVSRWRLDTGGHLPTVELLDVAVTVKYTAEAGGEAFATAVRGMLKPHPAARFFDVATEFPDAWQEFQSNGTGELVLPITPDLFPGISGRQITGIYARYQLAQGGAARFLLDGDRQTALPDGKLLRTSGLALGANGLTLQLDGDKTALSGVGLVLTYRAGV